MILNAEQPKVKKGIGLLAKGGLIAKGFVYVLLGALALLAAFHVGGQSAKDADRTGVLHFLNHSFGGRWLLPAVAVGLLCYAVWRFIEALQAMRGEDKSWKRSVRYSLSGLLYLSVSFSAFKLLFTRSEDNGDSQQEFASQVLSKPYGQWLLGLAALVIAGVGIYQIYYGLSEKYKKHVQKMNLHTNASSLILSSGKIGYVARGFVWLIIAYLMLQASMAASSAKAGDTSKAFEASEHSPVGPYLPAALGLGLIAYGVFNFIRARYEQFDNS